MRIVKENKECKVRLVELSKMIYRVEMKVNKKFIATVEIRGKGNAPYEKALEQYELHIAKFKEVQSKVKKGDLNETL